MTTEFNFTTLTLIADKYDGITIDNSNTSHTPKEFEKELINIIQNIKNKHLLWIKLPIEKSELIPLLTKYDFIFHHCNEKDLTLLKKLTNNPIIPTAKNHTLGVGAVVIENNKLLVIKDRFQKGYKLPGGHIDDRENISQALKREIFEETGIKIELESVVSLGHFSPAQFGESNLYVVCTAKALSTKIDILDSHEILEAKWIDMDDFYDCEEIHLYNKTMVKTALESKGLQIKQDNFFENPNQDKSYEFFF